MHTSLLVRYNKLLNKIFPFMVEYQGKFPNSATYDHIMHGVIFGNWIFAGAIVCKWALLINIPAIFFYAFYKELVIDKHKNHGNKVKIWSQIIERSSGFIPVMVQWPFLWI